MPNQSILGKTFPFPDSQLRNFFSDQLRCLFVEEMESKEAVCTLQMNAAKPELKELLGVYLMQIRQQAGRLEEIFVFLLIKPHTEPSVAIHGLTREIERIIKQTSARSITRDAALIVAVQKILHYKIATYGSLVQLATSLGMEDVTNLLAKSLQDEKERDHLFSDLAEKRINWLAEAE